MVAKKASGKSAHVRSNDPVYPLAATNSGQQHPYYERTTALIRMLRVSNLTTGVFERMTGIHIAQWRILAFVSAHPGCTQKELKDAHNVDPAAITRSVKLLEKGGLIERRPDEVDNRLTRVTLTSAGTRKVSDVTERRRLYMRQVLDGISDRDIDAFDRFLKKLEINALKMSGI